MLRGRTPSSCHHQSRSIDVACFVAERNITAAAARWCILRLILFLRHRREDAMCRSLCFAFMSTVCLRHINYQYSSTPP